MNMRSAKIHWRVWKVISNLNLVDLFVLTIVLLYCTIFYEESVHEM